MISIRGFYQGINQSSTFESITYLMNVEQQQAWAKFYFPYRLTLFSPRQQQLLRSHRIDKITQSALFSLYSPTSITNSQLLAKDPYFTFQHFITSLPKPATNVTLFHQRLMVNFNHRWYVMITAKLRGDSFSIKNQNSTVRLIKSAKKAMLSTYPNANLLKTGLLFYAKSGADMAQHDISIIGVGSLLGIILLMLLTFRSLSPIVFTLFSSALGFIAAFVVTSWLFGAVYLFTLVFGVSLIGISVDYAFFYYADQLVGGKKWHAHQGLHNIFTAITLGLLNVVLTYIVLLFAPVPGLRQLAVFAMVGLSVSYATVVCLFPYLLKAKQRCFQSPFLRLTNAYLLLWQKMTQKKLLFLYLLVGVIAVIGITQLHANDDIHALESMPTHLVKTGQIIQKAIGSKLGTTFYVIEGDSPQATLRLVDTVSDELSNVFKSSHQSYMGIAPFVPSIRNQKKNFDLTRAALLDHTLLNYLAKIGMSRQHALMIQKQLLEIKFQPLTIDAWLKSPVSKSLRFLWLGKIGHKYVSIILLSTQLKVSTLQHIAAQHRAVTYVNKAVEVSTIFKLYRQKISLLLLIVCLLLALFFMLRYRFKKGLIYFLPSLSASLVSLAVMGLFGVPLTLFSILALFLVLGLSVDDVLFFAETKTSYQSTMLAVTLSAMTTLLSFGLLSLSTTPVIHYFGLTVLIGTFVSFMLSPSVTILGGKK